MIRATNVAKGAAILVVVCLLARSAAAQQLLSPRLGGYSQVPTSQISNPVVSPYLLMTEVGQSGILNYQTLVQPFVQQRQVTLQQNSSILQLQQQARAQAAPTRRPGHNIRDTGHETRDLNYSHYFGSGGP